MIQVGDNRFVLPAWGVSLTLHGAIVGLALIFSTQVKPILPEDVFKWDVALVETVKSELQSEPTQSAVTTEEIPSRVVPPSKPKRILEKTQAVRPQETKIDPAPPSIEPIQPIERKVEPLQPREEPIEPKAESFAVATPASPIESRPTQLESPPDVSVAAASQDATASLESHENSVDDSPTQKANAAVPGSEVKLDNQWLAESLWRRVAELKRYPNSARLNGQEGRVILKAVIRADGHLADVSIQKSSGHDLLDAAAVEAVKLACPLHMKHDLGKAQIVVSLPIVYSLAN